MSNNKQPQPVQHTDSKHTPGPWVLVKDDVPSNQFIANEQDGKCLLVICNAPEMNLYKSFEAWSANAALIVQAPELYEENQVLKQQRDELLEALKEIMEPLTSSGQEVFSGPFKKAISAIKKATQQ